MTRRFDGNWDNDKGALRGIGDMGKKNNSKWIRGCKERGEWAELCFMARAAGMGMSVSKPHGDSRRYDVLVETGRRIVRVQVKSTIYRRRGKEYSLNVMGPGRKRYAEGSVDFFAVYLIPERSGTSFRMRRWGRC
jgi:PD-(D/E)XK endonuclease